MWIPISLGILIVLGIIAKKYKQSQCRKLERWHSEDMVVMNKELFNKKKSI